MWYYNEASRRALVEDFPIGKTLRVRERKNVPSLETFREAMSLLNAKRVSTLKGVTEGVVYIPVSDHLIVVVEVS